MCELDGNFRGQSLLANAIEDHQVVAGDLPGFRRVRDVFAQAGEDRSQTLVPQVGSGFQRGIDGFAGHEARDALAHKPQPGRQPAQPRALRTSQQHSAHDAHFFSGLTFTDKLSIAASVGHYGAQGAHCIPKSVPFWNTGQWL